MMLDDDDLLAGVPDDTPEAVGITDAELLEMEADAEIAAAPEPPAPAPPTEAPGGATPSVGEEEAMEPAAEAEAVAVRKSGKRRVIEHGWSSDPAAVIDPLAPGELARRAARAAKFGMQAPAPPAVPAVLISREEVLAREARAAKFGVAAPFNPLDAIASAAGGLGKGLWEKRRDAAPDEVPRPEAVYIYGTDRLSTEELLLLFAGAGVGGASPHHAEWVDDSSAVVVFPTGDDAEAALLSHTDLLVSLAEGGEAGTDQLTWRTTPPNRAAAGKGLQLLFRRATQLDLKPARRNASRWYGEAKNKKEAKRGGGVAGGGIGKSGRAGAARTLAAALGAANQSGVPGLAAALASGGAVLKRGEADLRRRLRVGQAREGAAPGGEAGPVGRGRQRPEEEMEE